VFYLYKFENFKGVFDMFSRLCENKKTFYIFFTKISKNEFNIDIYFTTTKIAEYRLPDYDPKIDDDFMGSFKVCAQAGQLQILYKIKYPRLVQFVIGGFGDTIHLFTIAHKIAKIIDYLLPRDIVIQRYPLESGFWFDDDRGNGEKSFISFSSIGEIYLNQHVITFEEIRDLYPYN